ncbi:hypothetical protein EXE09_09375 [Acinetobacter sp. WCHAc060025]|nr:hypothetical protein EXE09_09375 [Acinetobacter sp. WCHAc060025]
MKNYQRLMMILSLLGIGLSGCATTLLTVAVHEQDHYSTKKVLVMRDQLIAIGRASQPISGYEDALVIAGEKYSYLVTSDQKSKITTQNLNQILQQFDLQNLSLYQAGWDTNLALGLVRNENPKNPILFEMKKERETQGKNMHANIYLVYRKSLQHVKPQDQAKLKQFDFECVKSKVELQCKLDIAVDLRLAQQVANKNQLQHRFKQPVDLIVYQTIEKSKVAQTAKNIALYPLAITFDIVTSPLQLIGFLTWKTPSI